MKTHATSRPRWKVSAVTTLCAGIVTSSLGACSDCGKGSSGNDAGGDAEAGLDGATDVRADTVTGESDATLDSPTADGPNVTEGGDGGEPPACEAGTPEVDAGVLDAALGSFSFDIVKDGDGGQLIVQVVVNGVTIPAVLDTGSSGLRVMQSVVEDAGLVPLDDASAVVAQYNGGEVLFGYAADASVSVGGMAIGAVTIQVVTTACTVVGGADGSTDPDAGCAEIDSGILHHNAILGIGLRPSATDGGTTLRSPLAVLPGFPAFVVRIDPDAGIPSANAGTVQVGATDTDREGFKYWVKLQGDAPDWHDLGVQSCIRDESSHGPCWTQGTFVDTGDPEPYIELLDAQAPVPGMPLADGGTAEIRLLGQNGCLIDSYSVAAPSVAVRRVTSSPTYNNVSLGAFFRMDVLYDPRNGWMAFYPKP